MTRESHVIVLEKMHPSFLTIEREAILRGRNAFTIDIIRLIYTGGSQPERLYFSLNIDEAIKLNEILNTVIENSKNDTPVRPQGESD